MQKTKRVKPEIFLQAILAGYNPNTGEELSNTSPFKHAEVIKEIKEFLEDNRYDSKIISIEDGRKIMDGELFEKLRKKRMEIANKLGYKPYHILGNEALIRLIIYGPKTIDDAKKIKYIGEKNIEHVPSFLEILNNKKLKTPVEKEIARNYIKDEDTCVDCGVVLDWNYRMEFHDRDRCSKHYKFENNNRMHKTEDFKGSFEDWENFNKRR
jgi:hypothetical protein